MSPDDALTALSQVSPKQGEDWGSMRARQHAASEALAVLKGQPLRAALPQIIAMLEATHDIGVQQALAVPLARAELELEPTPFVELVARNGYAQPWLNALEELGQRGTDVWPLVRDLATSREVRVDDARRALADYFTRHPTAVKRFDEALELWPESAVAAAWGSSLVTTPLVAFLPSLANVAVSGRSSEELRIAVLKWLVAAKAFDDELATRLERLWPGTSLDSGIALARYFVRRALAKRQSPTAFLRDPRPEVRRAALSEFVLGELPRSGLAALLDAWGDSDSVMRETAERELRHFVQREGLTPDELRPIAALLSPERDDIAIFLSWAATEHPTIRDWCLQQLDPASPLFAALSAKYTLACAACGPLGKGANWSHSSSEPKAYAALELVASLESGDSESLDLMRCKQCHAHYTLSYRAEIDVNSRHDDWLLWRLTLAQLKARFASRADLADPRFEHWYDAARSDLQHLDPRVRSIAEWELADLKAP